ESRARESRIGAWASEQGSVIESREQLLAQVEEAGARFEGEGVQRPPHWGGYIVRPEAIEFWQAGEFRLHDRFVYRRSDGGQWVTERLSP
ncbi:MAG: pyridoxamine 5'-phosphate oxidase, partial [Solirubrobacteraceae bacterium]|nr:pyridoxamine 5'-phosphate oxidase [Solirubrobacteraceae bacterium]